jgi:hypothetical protein
LIKGIGLIGVGTAGYVGIKQWQHTQIRARYQYLNELRSEFGGEDAISHRRKIAAYWGKRIIRDPNKSGPVKLADLGKMVDSDELYRFRATPGSDLGTLLDNREREMLGYLEREAGIKYESLRTDDVDKEVLESTQKTLNRYEHLGNLYEAKGVSKDDIKLLFYTTIMDTFVLTLPYILERRRGKPQYATKMQKLLVIVPYLSSNIELV